MIDFEKSIFFKSLYNTKLENKIRKMIKFLKRNFRRGKDDKNDSFCCEIFYNYFIKNR